MSLAQAELGLPGDGASVALARAFTRATLTGWGYRGSVDDVVLVVGELVTNAVVHGGRTRSVRLVGSSRRARIEVADDSPELPIFREPGLDGGWGLRLVERISGGSWGVSLRGGGKVVWCEVGTRLRLVVEPRGGRDVAP